MTVVLTRDPEEFAARAGDFLAERIECNVLVTVLMGLRAGRFTTGPLRLANAGDRSLLVGWMKAFAHEAGVIGADQSEAMVDARLDSDGALLWEHGGPVSMIGTAPPVAGVVRIGPVYTPPERRRRGYAGSAVAATSRRALAHGARRCMLYTDLANPTSNKIYAEVGFERSGGWEEHAFSSA